jgi:hypothetical protein
MRERSPAGVIIGSAALFALAGCEGQSCTVEWQAMCDAQNKATMICQPSYENGMRTGLKWQKAGDYCVCAPQDGVIKASCAVPGFVGIARAGRPRPAAPGLRAVT